jgi:hypothetical protein
MYDMADISAVGAGNMYASWGRLPRPHYGSYTVAWRVSRRDASVWKHYLTSIHRRDIVFAASEEVHDPDSQRNPAMDLIELPRHRTPISTGCSQVD